MKIRSKAYRIFSALMLVLFLSSIILPVGTSAAALCCDMDIADSRTCCEAQAIAKTDYLKAKTTDNSCGDQEICYSILSDSQIKAQAVISHHANGWMVLTLTADKEIKDSLKNYKKVRIVKSSLLQPNYSPPLFLLNSSFLN